MAFHSCNVMTATLSRPSLCCVLAKWKSFDISLPFSAWRQIPFCLMISNFLISLRPPSRYMLGLLIYDGRGSKQVERGVLEGNSCALAFPISRNCWSNVPEKMSGKYLQILWWKFRKWKFDFKNLVKPRQQKRTADDVSEIIYFQMEIETASLGRSFTFKRPSFIGNLLLLQPAEAETAFSFKIDCY